MKASSGFVTCHTSGLGGKCVVGRIRVVDLDSLCARATRAGK